MLIFLLKKHMIRKYDEKYLIMQILHDTNRYAA